MSAATKIKRKLTAMSNRLRRSSTVGRNDFAGRKIPIGGIVVNVQVMKGTGLSAGDGSTPSPAVILECGQEKVVTDRQKGQVNPIWFVSYKFGYKQKIYPEEDLIISAVDGDKTFGSYKCPLKNLIGKPKHDVWFPLVDGLASKGRVLVSLEVCRGPPPVIYSGSLSKKGGAHGGWRNWQSRWFVLTLDAFSYYESEEAFEQGDKPKGVILMNAYYVSMGDETSDGFEFTVNSYPKSVRCKAATSEIRSKWVDILLKPVTMYNRHDDS